MPSTASCSIVAAGMRSTTSKRSLEIGRQCGTRKIPVVVCSPEGDAVEAADEQLERLSPHTARAGPSGRSSGCSTRRCSSSTARSPGSPPRQRRTLEQLYENDRCSPARRCSIVDDDIRNIFAMTSVLERQQMDVDLRRDRQGGDREARDTPDIDIVLMDIMMPDMDGYDTMRAIRKRAGSATCRSSPSPPRP